MRRWALVLLIFLMACQTKNLVCIGELDCLQVEPAISREARALGLQNHTSLGGDEAMLLVFPQSAHHGIWMKNMSFPIDAVWIAGHQVVYVEENLSPCTTDCPVYKSNTNARFVLETQAGYIEENNVRVGDPARVILR